MRTMIFGNCPYCDGSVSTPCAPHTPAFSREMCPHCNRRYWLMHSKVSPEAWTEETFKEKYELDEATGDLWEKAPSKKGKNSD